MTDLSSRERAVLADEAQWRANRAAELRQAAASRPRPSLADVRPGWSVWSTSRVDSHDGPVGGVVLQQVGAGGGEDEETGEILPRRSTFRVIDPFPSQHPNFHILEASDVNLDTIEQPEPWRLHLLISRLARELVSHGSTRRSLLSHADERLRLVASMHHLAGATRPEHRAAPQSGRTP